MNLSFRNLDLDPALPVEEWPYEAVVTAIERGSATDWARLTAAIRRDPWGVVARQVEEYLGYARTPGVGALLARAVAAARTEAEQAERDEVAATVQELVVASGLGTVEFARRIGTSRSRLSTYRSGRVVPSATLLVRMRRVAQDAGQP